MRTYKVSKDSQKICFVRLRLRKACVQEKWVFLLVNDYNRHSKNIILSRLHLADAALCYNL